MKPIKLTLPHTGAISEMGSNPIAAALLTTMLRGQKFHRGTPPPAYRYSGDNSQQMDCLDEANRNHVLWALQNRAKKLKCPVGDLAWALVPGRAIKGIYPVAVKPWVEVERAQFNDVFVQQV